MNYLLEKFKLVDFLSQPVLLTHRGQRNIKTYPGSIMTLILGCFMAFSIIFFGLEIVQKRAPQTRFSKTYSNISAVNIKDFPLMLEFMDPSGKHFDEIGKLLTLDGLVYYITDKDRAGSINYKRVYMEPCDPEVHFGQFKEFLSDKSLGLKLEHLFCLSGHKSRNQSALFVDDGPMNTEDDIAFYNEYSSFPSSMLTVLVKHCSEELDSKTCKSEEEREKILGEFYSYFHYVDSYLNIDDYENPVKYYLSTYSQQLSYNSYKRNYYSFKNVKVITDGGWLMEEINTEDIIMFGRVRSNVSQKTYKMYELTFESPKLIEVHSRQYTKIQDLLAKLGGLFKAFIVFGKACVYFLAKAHLYNDIGNEFLEYQNFEELKFINHQSHENIQIHRNKSSIENIPKKENIFHKINRKPVSFSMCDYVNVFCCRNDGRHMRSEYKAVKSFTDKHLDLSVLIKHYQIVDKLRDMLVKKEDADAVFYTKIDLKGIDEEYPELKSKTQDHYQVEKEYETKYLNNS